ncbi:hypothetical protein Tco_0218094 [Tanacetum coccineum]
MSSAAQIARDEEVARQLEVELQAEVEMERQREEEASKAAIAKTEEYTIEEREKFLAKTIAAQRKFRAAQRSTEIKSRPPTKSQLRNLMMTYLKNMGGYKHSQLKAKTFVEIQGLYKRQKRIIDDFKPIDSDDVVKDTEEATGIHKEKVLEEPDSTKVEVKQEGHKESIRKRTGRRLKMKETKKSKRQKTDANLEEEEHLKTFLKIVPDEEGIIDYEVDLRIMFDANVEDELWQNQERWNLKSWDFYENCGVHTLILELIDESASDGAYKMLRFIQKQIDEFGSYDRSEEDL